ncbi:MAG TPA: YdcF family protein [Gammaproteobacteria bacterium]|nr:YdcF family protein [Gammaproteobacteria bacterium]
MDRYFIWNLIEPSHLILYSAVVGVVLWPLRIGKWCRGACVLLVVVLGLLPVAWALMTPLEQRFGFPKELDRVDGIVMLAGAENGRLSDVYAEPQLDAHGDRLTTFLMLAGRFPGARLVHSGDAEPHSQSAVARSVLLGAGLDPARIVFENRSRSTCNSPASVRELVAPRPDERWLLVTSAVHMPRAVACFRAAGWDVIPYPTDFSRGPAALHFGLTDNLQDLDEAAHEWVGLLFYRLMGYTTELLPAPSGERCPTAACSAGAGLAP